MIRQGDKFLCTEDVNNFLGWPLFKKGEVYNVLYVENEKAQTYLVLDHILYGNEYMEYELDWILKNFKKI